MPAHAADRPVPFTLTPKGHAALEHKPFPPIVCLCGSTRFVAEFNRQRKELTERGQIVLSIEVVTTQAREHDPQHADPALKARLDELHKRKIDLADYVLVLNVGGYIGASTRAEIAYAAALGKPVRYLEPPAAGPGPVMECGCGYIDCSACAGYGWACLRCGVAYFGTPPDDGLCAGCRNQPVLFPQCPECRAPRGAAHHWECSRPPLSAGRQASEGDQ